MSLRCCGDVATLDVLCSLIAEVAFDVATLVYLCLPFFSRCRSYVATFQ